MYSLLKGIRHESEFLKSRSSPMDWIDLDHRYSVRIGDREWGRWTEIVFAQGAQNYPPNWQPIIYPSKGQAAQQQEVNIYQLSML